MRDSLICPVTEINYYFAESKLILLISNRIDVKLAVKRDMFVNSKNLENIINMITSCDKSIY